MIGFIMRLTPHLYSQGNKAGFLIIWIELESGEYYGRLRVQSRCISGLSAARLLTFLNSAAMWLNPSGMTRCIEPGRLRSCASSIPPNRMRRARAELDMSTDARMSADCGRKYGHLRRNVATLLVRSFFWPCSDRCTCMCSVILLCRCLRPSTDRRDLRSTDRAILGGLHHTASLPRSTSQIEFG